MFNEIAKSQDWWKKFMLAMSPKKLALCSLLGHDVSGKEQSEPQKDASGERRPYIIIVIGRQRKMIVSVLPITMKEDN